MARAPSTNIKAPKRVHKKPRKEAAKSYIPFKARVLAAVYRISKSKHKAPRSASFKAIKSHLIARGNLHPSRYPQFKPKAFSTAKSGLESANIVYQPKHTLSFATTTETRKDMEDRLQNISEDDSADEQAAKALLSSPRGAPRATSTAPKSKKVRIIRVDLSSESESDDGAEPVRVKKRSRGSGTKATKKPRQQATTRQAKKPRRKIETASEGEEEEEEGTEVEVDELELGLEENTIPAQTRRRRPTVKAKTVAPKPTKRATATSKRSVAASADQPLSTLRKAELVEKVEELVKEKEEMRLAWEKEKELVAVLQEERDRLQQQKQVLAQGFNELREVNAELKLRLSQHEDITETEDSLRPGDQDASVVEEGFAVGFGDEGEGAMDDDLGEEDDLNLQFDDSGFGDVDAILKLKVDSREASMVPDSENEREPIPSSRILQRPIAPIEEEEGDDAHSFTSSYPELTVDSASRARRRSRTPEVAGPQQESWASQHPPSPAASQDGAQDEVMRDEEGRLGHLELGGRASFPTPDPSSPLKLGDHTVQRPRQDPQDDEESILSPTVIDEDVEEEEAQLQTVVESAEAYRVTIARLEREVEEVKIEMGEIVLSKELLRDELELVTRRYQDEVQSTTATLGRVNEEAVGLQKQIDSLHSHLEAARQSVGDERGRADLLETELNDANLALATARDTTAENTKELDQLSARATAAQDRVGVLEGQLVLRAEELAVSQTRINELETSLEQLRSAHAELMQTDANCQNALSNVNLNVFELRAEVQSLKKVEERELAEKGALQERAASLEVAVAESEQQLEVASKALADQQHRSVTLQSELDVVSKRYQEEIESVHAELEAAASIEVKMQQTISQLEVQVSSTESQVEEERKHVKELQQALEVAQSTQQQMESEQSSTLTDLKASLDVLKNELASAHSAHDSALAEKSAVQEQLSTARQQLDEAHQLIQQIQQGSRGSEALKRELDLVTQRHRDVDEAHALQVKNMSDNLSIAEQTIATLEEDLADCKSRAKQLEEEATAATSRYAELVAAHDAAQEALAESTSKIDNLSGEFESTAAARDNFEAQATACQSDRLSLQQQLAFVQRQLDSTSKEQKDRVTSLNAEIEEMARAFQGQREEAVKELAIANKERAEVETTAATLQEQVEVTHKALVGEQNKAEQLDNRLSGVTESFNALVLEKESLRTAISNAQKEVDSLSAKAEGLGADFEQTRAEKATLAGHNLMLEQDLTAARGQATTSSNALAEEKRVMESLRVELATEVEARQSILLDLHQAQERAASLQTSYEVVCTAEAELRASLRSIVTSRGIVPPSSILSSSSNDTPLAYLAALTHHLADLDDQISVLSSSLHSAQTLSQHISNAIPDHLVEPIHPDVEDSQETVALERSLKKVLDRVALLAEAFESSSAEDEAKHVARTMSTGTSEEVHRLEKILETLKSELLQLAAIVGPEAASQELGSNVASPAFEGLPFLVENMKTQALEVEHVDEEKKGEIGRLKAELVEEAAKRSRAVLKLGEKTKECVQLEEGIAALKVKHERALSAIKQASEVLKG